MLKIKLNNKGLGRKETMAVLLLIIVALSFGLYKVLGNSEKTQITNFKRLANTFASDAGVLRDNEILYEEKVFLYDVINLNYGDELKSPFNAGETCDIYESKIEMENRSVYVTFKCSDYYIYHQLTTEEEYIVYKVSEWTDQKLLGENVQSEKFYNYSDNGEEQFGEYMKEKEFLVEYSIRTGYSTNFISNIKSGHELLEKTFYRTIEEVK